MAENEDEELSDGISPWKKGKEIPSEAFPVHTYDEYQDYVRKWANGDFEGNLLVIGGAGLGKSEMALRSLDSYFGREHEDEDDESDTLGEGDYCYLKGNATVFGVYNKLYAYRDKPVVLDDVDDLLADRSVTTMLKPLLETREVKVVQWTSGKTLSDKYDLPSSFKTTSRTLILANEVKQDSKNFKAVLDRAFVVWFAPSAEEVHRYVGTWFNLNRNQDVYDYIGERLIYAASPSCRIYYKTAQTKAAGLDWRAYVDSHLRPDKNAAAVMKSLLENKDLKTDKERVKVWKEKTGLGQVSYYQYKKAVNAANGIGQSERAKRIGEGVKAKNQRKKQNDE